MTNKDIEITHSKANMFSYGCGSLSREFLLIAFNTLVFFYYEVEIGLNVWYVGMGLIIFVLYNAINDPLVGYLTNRPFKFTKRLGRRFPWILLGGIPLGFSYFLVFSPPNVDPKTDPLILFGWLVFVTCFFDTTHTIFYVNFQALFPDKFRSVKERRTATGIEMFLGVLGVSLGSIIPPILITFGDLQSYLIQGVVVSLFGLITMLMAIPGTREDKKMVDNYLASYDKDIKRESLGSELRLAFKQKSFVAFIVLYTMYWALVNSMTASMPYVLRYIVKEQLSSAAISFGTLFLGTVISIPFWVKLAQKINDNRKIMTIAGFLMGFFIFPLMFLDNFDLMLINMFLWGFALGGFWVMIFPIFSEISDEVVVKHHERKEGTLTGIQQFFGRLGMLIQVLSFFIVHSLTGFVEGADTQSATAILGIKIHFAIVPMICIFFGSVVFWMLYDLTPDKIAENQLKIKEMKL